MAGAAGPQLQIHGERFSGQDVRTQNTTAVLAVANILKTSLGPVGLDKVSSCAAIVFTHGLCCHTSAFFRSESASVIRSVLTAWDEKDDAFHPFLSISYPMGPYSRFYIPLFEASSTRLECLLPPAVSSATRKAQFCFCIVTLLQSPTNHSKSGDVLK
jgi:hypothetical protein